MGGPGAGSGPGGRGGREGGDARATLPARLVGGGFRLTGPRRAVLAVLVASPRPMTVAEIHARVRGRLVNLVSVYRALHLFGELGLIRLADISRGAQRFELSEEFTGHHHHLICQGCGRIDDIEGCLLPDGLLGVVNRRVRRLKRFRVTDHDLRLYGFCDRCGVS